MSTEQKDYTEKIVIKNFGGITDLEMPINKINVLIGPQAAGKSMAAKLLFYFKEFLSILVTYSDNEYTKQKIDNDYIAKFKKYFPSTAWPKGHFEIHYFIGNIQLSIYRKNVRSIKFKYSDIIKEWINSNFIENILKDLEKTTSNLEQEEDFNLAKLLGNLMGLGVLPSLLPLYILQKFKSEINVKDIYLKQILIPAGRNFYADIQANIFSFLENKKQIDPFLVKFGTDYDFLKNNTTLNDNAEKILKAKYKRERNKDFLVHKDGRKVNLSYASSGQQEVLPLLVILQDILSGELATNGATLYIEEPEAHLFPNAQKEIVELLAKVVNSPDNNIQIVVTTHSPYILSAFNNLLYAGQIEENNAENERKLKSLYETVEKESIVKPNTLNAFAMVKGEKINIIDEETQLIGSNVLDEISNVIANQFDKLLDLDDE